MAAFLLGEIVEEWRDVPGYEGLYQVSNLGKVRVKERYVTNSRNKNMKTRRNPKKMSPIDHGNGYMYVTLTKNGQRCNRYIHRLVADAFIPNPMSLHEVDHINRVRNDNRAENLRWVDRQDNIENSKAHGPRPNHWLKPSSWERHILFRDGKWVVQIQRRDLRVYKTFGSKKEAVAYRDSCESEVI